MELPSACVPDVRAEHPQLCALPPSTSKASNLVWTACSHCPLLAGLTAKTPDAHICRAWDKGQGGHKLPSSWQEFSLQGHGHLRQAAYSPSAGLCTCQDKRMPGSWSGLKVRKVALPEAGR